MEEMSFNELQTVKFQYFEGDAGNFKEFQENK